jgi:hypothetical protein
VSDQAIGDQKQIPAYGMNLGRMLVLKNVNEWNREKVANGMIDTGPISTTLIWYPLSCLTVERFRDEPIPRIS